MVALAGDRLFNPHASNIVLIAEKMFGQRQKRLQVVSFGRKQLHEKGTSDNSACTPKTSKNALRRAYSSQYSPTYMKIFQPQNAFPSLFSLSQFRARSCEYLFDRFCPSLTVSLHLSTGEQQPTKQLAFQPF